MAGLGSKLGLYGGQVLPNLGKNEEWLMILCYSPGYIKWTNKIYPSLFFPNNWRILTFFIGMFHSFSFLRGFDDEIELQYPGNRTGLKWPNFSVNLICIFSWFTHFKGKYSII